MTEVVWLQAFQSRLILMADRMERFTTHCPRLSRRLGGIFFRFHFEIEPLKSCLFKAGMKAG
jgi:hypothetical protein